MTTREAAESRIVGCDTGPENSAYVVLVGSAIGEHGWIPNAELQQKLAIGLADDAILAIETLHPRGEPVSMQAMDAQLWAGRFISEVERRGTPFVCVDERDGRFAASGNQCATAKHVRIGLQNLFGEDQQKPCECGDGTVPGARGPKKCPTCKGRKFVTVAGPLAGLGEHERCALAAALYVQQSRGVTLTITQRT